MKILALIWFIAWLRIIYEIYKASPIKKDVVDEGLGLDEEDNIN
jgi:hypothetical protein